MYYILHDILQFNLLYRLPYVEALLLESQRLQYMAPTLGPRRVLKDTTLDKYFIPKVNFQLKLKFRRYFYTSSN